MIKLLTIVGARPQFIKAAVLSRLIASPEYCGRVKEYLVHTGQHYDNNMSGSFFAEMQIPAPDFQLLLGGGSHGEMTGRMLIDLERVLNKENPDLVMVYGDTNSTLAGALAASKLGLAVAHVEAGLRSNDKKMPEEQNRILVDHLSTYLFCPTRRAVENLQIEGISASSDTVKSSDSPGVFLTGDIMYDAAMHYSRVISETESNVLDSIKKVCNTGFGLLTVHRAENTNSKSALSSIIRAIGEIQGEKFIFPVHPRTSKAIADFEIRLPENIIPINPVGYFDMLRLEMACRFVVTDSGGVQKEACFWGKPCITLRKTTEWTETVDAGWNVLVGSDENLIKNAILSRPSGGDRNLYGDGNSAYKILNAML